MATIRYLSLVSILYIFPSSSSIYLYLTNNIFPFLLPSLFLIILLLISATKKQEDCSNCGSKGRTWGIRETQLKEAENKEIEPKQTKRRYIFLFAVFISSLFIIDGNIVHKYNNIRTIRVGNYLIHWGEMDISTSLFIPRGKERGVGIIPSETRAILRQFQRGERGMLQQMNDTGIEILHSLDDGINRNR